MIKFISKVSNFLLPRGNIFRKQVSNVLAIYICVYARTSPNAYIFDHCRRGFVRFTRIIRVLLLLGLYDFFGKKKRFATLVRFVLITLNDRERRVCFSLRYFRERHD